MDRDRTGASPPWVGIEAVSSLWQVRLDWDKRFNIGGESEGVSLAGEAGIADAEYLSNLVESSNAGSGQLAGLAKQWEASHSNAVRLLKEELESLNTKRKEADGKRRRILDENVFYKMQADAKRSVLYEVPLREDNSHKLYSPLRPALIEDKSQVSAEYWKDKAHKLNQLLAESLHREEVLMQTLQEKSHSGTKHLPIDDLQNQLERVDNFLHFVLRNAPLVVSHQDREQRYRFVYNHFPGYQVMDIIGKTDLELYKGTNSLETFEFKAEVLRRGCPAKREFVYENEEIGTKAFLVLAEPVFSKTGETIGLNVISLDITEEVANREKLICIREEKAVQKAMETELHKTMLITEETMKAKQLLATMSHEIRSPLSGVISMAEILAATNLDPEQQGLVDIMLGSGDLVLQLINDILDLSKAESGAMKLEAKKFRPREIVKNVLQMGAASIQKKSLTLEGSVSDEVPVEVIGDVLRIRQILTNLVSNAIKFTHEGTVRVVLKVISDSSKKPSSRDTQQGSDGSASQNTSTDKVPQWSNNGHTIWLECEVLDTGIGIPGTALPFLFTKYMQVSETHARKYGGTGLGLAICKQLVELMGGKLKVTSKENHGSAFSFTLPCKLLNGTESCSQLDPNGSSGQFRFLPTTWNVARSAAKVQDEGENRSSMHVKCVTSTESLESSSKCTTLASNKPVQDGNDQTVSENLSPKKQPKVLLVEDNKVNIMVAQSMLRRLKLEPRVVNNGAEAVQAVREEYYDLILMDRCMPVMDGLEATRLIRKHQEDHMKENECETASSPRSMQRRRSSIVALTANALAENVEECYTCGMDSFISKPVTFGKLQQVIRQFLPQLSLQGGSQS